MKTNTLRAPLVKSGLVLVVLVLVVYLTTTTDGSIFSAIGLLIKGIFRTIQLAIGLVIGLTVSITVLIGIFLGAVALFDREVAGSMYQGLLARLSELLGPWFDTMVAARVGKKTGGMQKLESREVQHKLMATVDSRLESVSGGQAELHGKLEGLAARLKGVEGATGGFASSDSVTSLAQSMEDLQATVSGLEATVKAIAEKLDALTPEKLTAELGGRVAHLESTAQDVPAKLSPLHTAVDTIRNELADLGEQVADLASATFKAASKKEEAVEGSDGDDDAEHRLFVYFTSEEDQRKLADLVASTLKKDMTYAQVTDFLIKEMGSDGGKIIAEHPSLVKDYIRQCRRSS